MKTLALIASLLVSAVLPMSKAAASEIELAPFSVNFEVNFRGMNAGSASLELTRDNGGTWRYVSKNTARGIFRLAFPGEIRQTSILTLAESGVKPLRYQADDGTGSRDRDIQLQFDWAAGRVRGTAENAPVDVPIESGLQDGMSVQIALMRALARGETPTGFKLIDKDEIKEYVYSAEKPVRLRTTMGEIDTVVWVSHRPNANRLTRVWYAPSLGYLPIQAERRKGDTVEWSMRLKTWRR